MWNLFLWEQLRIHVQSYYHFSKTTCLLASQRGMERSQLYGDNLNDELKEKQIREEFLNGEDLGEEIYGEDLETYNSNRDDL